MTHGYEYTFPAIRGIQAGREYYVAMCPLKLLPKLFLFDEEEVPPELRAQRTINKARIPEIAKYLVENADDFVFSAITASIDGEVSFEPAESDQSRSDVGYLFVSMTARLVINDGQHRRAAIETALQERPELGDETIAVVFFRDAGLKRSQQLFTDLNKHAVRPTKSLGILYDYREPLASLARHLADNVPIFKGFTEKEKTTISNRSIKLFTLSAIYQASGALLGKAKSDEISNRERDMALKFWTKLAYVIPEWQLVIEKEVSSAQLRRDFTHAHSVALHALGIAGGALIQQFPKTWPEKLNALRDLDWSRSNVGVWEGRAMVGGQMSKARQNLTLTSNLIKITLGLELEIAEEKLEKRYLASKTTVERKTQFA